MNLEDFDFTNSDINDLISGNNTSSEIVSVKDLKYLEKFGYSTDEISYLLQVAPSILKQKLAENDKLVCQNLQFLKDLGVVNLKEIFNRYYDVFLMDYSNFTSIFQKYDPQDLVEKLAKNVEIIDFL